MTKVRGGESGENRKGRGEIGCEEHGEKDKMDGAWMMS